MRKCEKEMLEEEEEEEYMCDMREEKPAGERKTEKGVKQKD